MSENKKEDAFVKAIENFFIFLWEMFLKLLGAVRECYHGYINNILPFERLTILSVLVSLFWTFQLDVHFLRLVHFTWPRFALSPPIGIFRMILWFTTTTAPFFAWGLRRQIIVEEILDYLREVFHDAGLVNNDKYPALIREYVTDSGSRILQLFSDGIVQDDYEAKRSVLENKLGTHIESIKTHPIHNRVVEIELASTPMPISYPLLSMDGFAECEFPVGKSRTEVIQASLKKIPHFLFAGMTGKGKSTAIKVVSTILLRNNRDLEVCFIDLKGVEAKIIEDHPRVHTATSFVQTLSCLNAIDKIREERNQNFNKVKAANIDEFNKIAAGNSAITAVPRILVVVDEVAQLMPSLATKDHATLKNANLILNRLARLGRSYGIHLIIGVQKPDSRNLEPTVKACLEGILSFSVANRSQSQIVLDSNQASDLGGIPGRAVWQVNGTSRILQAPFLSDETIKAYCTKEKNERGGVKSRAVFNDAGKQDNTEKTSADPEVANPSWRPVSEANKE